VKSGFGVKREGLERVLGQFEREILSERREV